MNLADHLPAIAVLLPMLAAPACVLIDRPRAAWLISQVAALLSFLAALGLMQRVRESGVVSYHLGGWPPPWGIEYRVDELGAFVLLIVTGIAAVVMLFAARSVEREVPEKRIARFYAALLLAFAGLAGIVVTGDAFNVFVFLEISSLASYALISMGTDRRALNAAFQYLVMGTIGATFILIGIGFLYMMTGTLNMLDLAARLSEVSDTRTVRAGFAFLTVGIGLKLAMFPLHLWLPNAYAYAPSAVSVFLSATATKVAVYLLLRLLLEVFGIDFSLGAMPLEYLLMILGLAGVLSASLVAVFQNDVKRMLAYSSIAQVGYMLLGISLASATGTAAAVLHVFNHALMKGALFLAVGAVAYRIGVVTVRDLAGLGRRMPWSIAALAIGGLSLIGVPPTAGFISKWYLVLAALEQGLWPIAVLVLIGSLIAVIYVWRLVEAAYFATPDPRHYEVREAPLSILGPVWILVAANLYFGINTEFSVGVAMSAAALLTGGGG